MEKTLSVGSQVTYGLHGKCTVTAVEERKLSGEAVAFYRLEMVRHPSARAQRPEPAIWIPVASAAQSGLRPMMDSATAAEVMSILSNREYYFDLQLPWTKAQQVLEKAIAREGAIGLAQALSYLYGIKRREVVFSPEVGRFAERVMKQILRELAEAQAALIKEIEISVNKALRAKLLPDQ